MGDIWLWQGIDATWRYNHRMNRLGSAVDGDVVRQSAASGTGPDRATIRTPVAHVNGDFRELANGHVTLRLQGAEGERLTAETTVFVPDSAGTAFAEPVLQGFDTYARASADKPMHLSFSVGDAVRAPGGWNFPVRAEWQGQCTSAECTDDGSRTDQAIDIYYSVLGSSTDLRLSRGTHSADVAWSDRDPGAPQRETLADGGVRALKGMSLTLSDEMHWLSYESTVGSELTLGFGNWRRGMKLAHPFESLFAYRQAGSATLSADVVDLRIPGATVSTDTVEASQRWRGWGRTAVDPAAQVTTPLPAQR